MVARLFSCGRKLLSEKGEKKFQLTPFFTTRLEFSALIEDEKIFFLVHQQLCVNDKVNLIETLLQWTSTAQCGRNFQFSACIAAIASPSSLPLKCKTTNLFYYLSFSISFRLLSTSRGSQIWNIKVVLSIFNRLNWMEYRQENLKRRKFEQE